MRQQIGWYYPRGEAFVNMNTKKNAPYVYSKYDVPIFHDFVDKEHRDEDPHEAMCRKLSNNAKTWHEIQLQILENQYLLLKYSECILNEQQGSVPMHVESSSFTTARQNTLVLLKKGKESL